MLHVFIHIKKCREKKHQMLLIYRNVKRSDIWLFEITTKQQLGVQ